MDDLEREFKISTNSLERIRSIIWEDMEKMKENPDLPSMASRYVDIYITYNGLEEALKRIKRLKTEMAETLLPDVMEASGVSTITLDSGFRVTGSARIFVSIADQPNAYEWLRNNGYDSIIKETVNSSTLAGVARELLEEGKELPEDLFNVNMRNNTSVTKTKNT